jgi:hypothetical protein
MTARSSVKSALALAHPAAPPATPEQVVRALGAVQAQDYAGALWAIGLRLGSSLEGSAADPIVPQATLVDVERAVSDATIVRTWAMRGTLHFVPAADLSWMLALARPATLAARTRRQRELELDGVALTRCETLIVRALRGGHRLTRSAAMALLEAHGIRTAAQRGIHVLLHLALAGVVCFGPREGKEPTFVLVDEWLAAIPAHEMSREEALAAIAKRYFTSHGPATRRDFARWTGLAAADANAAFESVKSLLAPQRIGEVTYWTPASGRAASGVRSAARTAFLLPGFDEYMLGYTDRSAALPAQHASRIVPGGNGVFRPTLVVDGQVVGTWTCSLSKNPASKSRVPKGSASKRSAVVMLAPFDPRTPLTAAVRRAIARAAGHYGRFLGRPELVVAP